MLPENNKPRRHGASPLPPTGRALLLLSACVVVLAGCGYAPPPVSGPAPSAPSASNDPTPGPSESGLGGGAGGGGAGGGGGEPSTPPVVYGWALPPTDTSPADNEGPAYGALRSSCDDAARYLEDTSGEGFVFHGFQNPRYVVLYYAGLALCRGELERAAALTAAALATYSASGLDRTWQPRDPATGEFYSPPRPPGYGEAECDLYRTLRSVLEQIDPDQIGCPGGGVPPFTWQEYEVMAEGVTTTVRVYDDPMTFDSDESLVLPAQPDPVVPDPIPPDDVPTDPIPSPTPSAE